MKIAYFLDIPCGLGGAGNLLLQQAGIMAKNHNVIVVIPCDEQGNVNIEYAGRCEKSGLVYRTLYYETSFNFYDIDYLQAVLISKIIRKFVIQEKIDFLHSVQINLAVEMVSRELKIPHLMNIYQLREEEFRLVYLDIFAKYHLCDSELYAKKWSSCLGIKSRCVRPVAPLSHIINRRYVRRQHYRIVMLGDVCSRKNQLMAIKAVERCLKEYNVTLEIAGNCSDSYGGTCQIYVEQHHLSESVVFRGFISDISVLLRDCDILLCTSTVESFPMSIVEAVTYGLTIISTPVAGVPEVFHDRYNAYIAGGFGAEDIEASIRDCIHDFKSGDIESIQEHARETWERNFSPDRVREQIDQYYHYIVKDGHIGDADLYGPNLTEQLYKLREAVTQEDGNPDHVSKRVLYYAYLKKQKFCGKAYIWGAGKLGRQAHELLRLLELDIEVIAFVDKNKMGMYCGLPIIKPEEIKYDEVDYFLISFAVGRDEIINYLNEQRLMYVEKIFLLP